jgi:hypothetical protein
MQSVRGGHEVKRSMRFVGVVALTIYRIAQALGFGG